MVKILMMEDDAAIRTIAAGVLSDMGYDVVEAPDAKSGFAAVLNHKPDVILSDFLMPGVFDVYGSPIKNLFEELASNPRTKDIPIIITSGLPKETVQSSVPQRLWPYIMSKPFDYLRLEEVIRGVLKLAKPSAL